MRRDRGRNVGTRDYGNVEGPLYLQGREVTESISQFEITVESP